MDRYILLASVALPFLGMVGSWQNQVARMSSWISLASSLGVWTSVMMISSAVAEPQVAASWRWLSAAQIDLVFGIDGLNISPLLLVATAFPLLFLFRNEKHRSSPAANALLLGAQFAATSACLSLDIFSYVSASTALGLCALGFGAAFCVDQTGKSHLFQGFRVASGGLLVLTSGLVLYQTTQPRTMSLWELAPELSPGGALMVLLTLAAGTLVRAPLRVSDESGPSAMSSTLTALAALVAWYGAVRISLSALQGPMAQIRPGLLVIGCLIALVGALVGWVRCRRGIKRGAALKALLLSHGGVLLVCLALLERTALTGGLLLAWSVPVSWLAIYLLQPWPSPALFVVPMLAHFAGGVLVVSGAYFSHAGLGVLVAITGALLLIGMSTWELLRRGEKSPAPAAKTRAALWVVLLLLAAAGLAPGPIADRIRPTVALVFQEGGR